MDWYFSNEKQKEFIKGLFAQRAINGIFFDINNFKMGKYSLDSERIDAIKIDKDIHNKIIKLLSLYKSKLIECKDYEIISIILDLHNNLIKLEDKFNLKFKTVELIDKSINEYKNLESIESTANTFMKIKKYFKILCG